MVNTKHDRVLRNIKYLLTHDMANDGACEFTSFELIKEILAQIPSINKTSKILVVDTFEFIPMLLIFGADRVNITYVARYPGRTTIASELGCNVIQEDFLTWKTDMKFDVVVGNPPYQLTKSKKLWPEFTRLSLHLTVPCGVTSLIIPSAWLTSNGATFKRVREILTTTHDTMLISRKVNPYFKIGHDILYFISRHRGYRGITRYVSPEFDTDVDLRCGIPMTVDECTIHTILKKLISSPDKKLPLVINDTISAKMLSKVQTDSHKFRCIYSTANLGWIEVPTVCYGSLKIAINFSSSYYSEKSIDHNMPITTECIGSLMAYHPISSINQGMMIRSYLVSKLYRFFVANYKKRNTGFSDAIKRRMIPMLAEKFWTDDELYKHFNLTQEEIDYVESKTK